MKRCSFAMLAAMLTANCAIAESAPSLSQESAVWKKHEYSFVFMGFTATYSCDGLADKLKILLMAAGARSDAKVRSSACPGGFGQPDKLARADLTFYTLARIPEGSSDSAAVQGAWRLVSIQQRQPREMSRGDCELVDQFKSDLLPLFTTRNVDNHTTCVPHQDAGSVIDLKFDSLTLPSPKSAQKNSE